MLSDYVISGVETTGSGLVFGGGNVTALGESAGVGVCIAPLAVYVLADAAASPALLHQTLAPYLLVLFLFAHDSGWWVKIRPSSTYIPTHTHHPTLLK